jgi:predicted DCC family thiol-disulfide oxidoreductase YuxK
MLWLESAAGGVERVLTRSAAALSVARYLGGIWRVCLLGYLLPAAVRDALYAFVARHRHFLSAARPTCVIAPPEFRHRFLD